MSTDSFQCNAEITLLQVRLSLCVTKMCHKNWEIFLYPTVKDLAIPQSSTDCTFWGKIETLKCHDLYMASLGKTVAVVRF